MRLPILLLLLLGISACVTETRVAGSNKPVIRKQTSNLEAANARIALGLRYLQKGDIPQAKYNLEKAKQHAPDSGEVHKALAYYYQRVNEPPLAEQAFEEALHNAPNDGSIMNNYGAFLCSQGRFDEAEKQFLQAVEQPAYTRVADAYENATVCAMEAKQYEKARKFGLKTLSYDARRGTALKLMSQLSLEVADVRAASFYLKRYLKLFSMDAETARLGYKIAYAQGSKVDQAKYAKILKSNYPRSYEDLVVQEQQ